MPQDALLTVIITSVTAIIVAYLSGRRSASQQKGDVANSAASIVQAANTVTDIQDEMITEQRGEIKALQGQQALNVQHIADLIDRLSAMEVTVCELQDERADLLNRLAVLEAQIRKLQSERDNLQTQVTILTEERDRLQAEIAELAKRVQSLNG